MNKYYIDNINDIEKHIAINYKKENAEAIVFVYNVMGVLHQHGFHVNTLADGVDCVKQLCQHMDDFECMDASRES